MKPRELPNLDPLVASLLARAPEMNFMQLCRLLEVRLPAAAKEPPSGHLLEFGALDTAAHEPVRFRPRPRTGFPAGEIASVEFDDERPDADSDIFGVQCVKVGSAIYLSGEEKVVQIISPAATALKPAGVQILVFD